MIRGMTIYEKEKIRIEYISLSISTNDKTNIMEYVERLIPHMLYQRKFGTVDFCGCVVNKQHIHFLIRKPYVPYATLQSAWHMITKNISNVYVKTVRYDMDGKYKYESVLQYILQQEEKHDEPVEYYKTPNWGYVIHKKKQKGEVIITKKPWHKSSLKYEESYMINGEFVTKQQYDEYMLTHVSSLPKELPKQEIASGEGR